MEVGFAKLFLILPLALLVGVVLIYKKVSAIERMLRQQGIGS